MDNNGTYYDEDPGQDNGSYNSGGGGYYRNNNYQNNNYQNNGYNQNNGYYQNNGYNQNNNYNSNYGGPSRNGGNYGGPNRNYGGPNGNYNGPGGPDYRGRRSAIISLVFGIIAIIVAWFGYAALAGIVCGVIGIYFSARAKRFGYSGGMQTVGLLLSLIGIGCGIVVFLGCLFCGGGYYYY